MSKTQIQSVRNQHEALALYIVTHPSESQALVAAKHNITQAWLSTIVNSDAFQVRLKELQDQVVSQVTQTLGEKLATAADIAVTKLTTEIENSQNPQFLLDSTDKLLARMGYNGKQESAQTVINNNNTVIQAVDSDLLAETRGFLKSIPKETVYEATTSPAGGLQALPETCGASGFDDAPTCHFQEELSRSSSGGN